uniref:ARAD1D24860p n=1 Tax=Blastobotrys adeninivorans TaxID=409370 RepID=A0A060TB37_BLAAD
MSKKSPSPLSSPSSSASASASSPSSSRRRSSIVDLLSAPPAPTDRRLSSVSNGDDDHAIVFSDWYDIQLSDLVQKEKVVYVQEDSSVQQAFEVMDSHGFTSIPIAASGNSSSSSVRTFDYADLTTYLLLVLGQIEPVQSSSEIADMIDKARRGLSVPVGSFVSLLGAKDPFVSVAPDATLGTAAEILGSGVHRIAVTSGDNDLEGIVSQRRFVRYIWENGRLFKSLQDLFQTPLSDLHIGSKNVVSVNGDELVITALERMHSEGVSSLAVVDNNNDLLGNISIVDTRLLTKSSHSAYLKYTCKQFLTVILSNRGLVDGKDTYPVFHVTKDSSLGRTIAKLVATNAHRLWIVGSTSGSGSSSTTGTNNPAMSPTIPSGSPSSVGGHLEGVISLTDIIHLFARRAGKDSLDPGAARQQRRRSSSSSVRPTRIL